MADDPDLRDVIEREQLLLDPAVRRSRTAAAQLLDPEFYEFGASGRVWDRRAILDMMATEDAPELVTENVTATRLADQVILLTYRTRSPGRTALRSSLWRRGEGGPWRIYFHQGTVQPEVG